MQGPDHHHPEAEGEPEGEASAASSLDLRSSVSGWCVLLISIELVVGVIVALELLWRVVRAVLLGRLLLFEVAEDVFVETVPSLAVPLLDEGRAQLITTGA